MSMKHDHFGDILKHLRKDSGFKTQKQLSESSGISQTTLSRIEAGIQKPMPDTLKMLAKYLQTSTYEQLMEKAGYFEKKLSYEDTIIEDKSTLINERTHEPYTLAAHHDGEDWTEEELEEIERFKQFVKSKRKQ
ncbi:helix-turn-helix domain-containing protein [Paenibacillus sp. SC116]|uniref:helix-turn-helix domain-containing protein n=1 Tax=Paenibacillus sp. SC116 TaxID=2968986 RepID=UPI00215B1CAC|nr:helix-turn-helix transcriptional regulator [Paenibacillus sp. SC116]MCR8844076.1 helix-turn-helix domain-containing protein [Paenibacillus sp. SC116]